MIGMPQPHDKPIYEFYSRDTDLKGRIRGLGKCLKIPEIDFDYQGVRLL